MTSANRDSLSSPLNLHEYADEPLYNIGAVVRSTGLTPATLRAWERRYAVMDPKRSDGGYRLYSERDIAILRWLKERVDEGMAISRAAALLEMELRQQREPAPVVVASTMHEDAHGESYTHLRQALLDAILKTDEARMEQLVSESFAFHGLERTCEQVVDPTLVEIGERWHRGELSPVIEHFASSYLRRKLHAVMDALPVHTTGKRILLGCAPGEWHDIGLLQLALYLRRRGHEAVYLGQNVPIDAFVAELRHLQPRLVCLSATTEASAQALAEMSAVVASAPAPRPIFGFGGAIFNLRPDLREQVQGIFLGESSRRALGQIEALLHQAPSVRSPNGGA